MDECGATLALTPTGALLLAGDSVELECVVADGLTLHLQETTGTVAYAMRGGSATWSFTARVEDGAKLLLDTLPWVSAAESSVTRSMSVTHR